MKINKRKIKKLVIKHLNKYPLINKYFSGAIINLINVRKNGVKKLLELNLVRYLFLDDIVLKNLEKYLYLKESIKINIDVPIHRLKTDFSEYYSVLAELETAQSLSDEGMKNITFIKKIGNPDIEYKDNGIVQYAEVKNLEDLDPEFPIIDNKLEAMGIIDPRFKRNYYIRLNDQSQYYNTIADYREELIMAVDKMVEILSSEYIGRKKLEDEVIRVNDFIFTISFDTKMEGYHMMFSGDVMKFGSNKDIFLKMSSVYSRFINNVAKGIKQLARNRGENIESIKRDRIYIFLNTGRNANFVPDELDKIIKQTSKILGIDDLVTLKIKL